MCSAVVCVCDGLKEKTGVKASDSEVSYSSSTDSDSEIESDSISDSEHSVSAGNMMYCH